MATAGNIKVSAGGTQITVLAEAATLIGDPFLLAVPLYQYANLDLPFSPNDPGLQFTYNTPIDTLLPSTLAFRFFNLMFEYSSPLFLGSYNIAINQPIIFEPPLRMCLSGVPEIWLVTSSHDLNYAGCFPQFSTDLGATWHSPKDITGAINSPGNATTGYTTTLDYPQHVDADYDDTLYVDLSESHGILPSFAATDRDNFRYPCYLANATFPQLLVQSGQSAPPPNLLFAPAFPTASNAGGPIPAGCGAAGSETPDGAGFSVASPGGIYLQKGPINRSVDPTPGALQTGYALSPSINPANVVAVYGVIPDAQKTESISDPCPPPFVTPTTDNALIQTLWAPPPGSPGVIIPISSIPQGQNFWNTFAAYPDGTTIFEYTGGSASSIAAKLSQIEMTATLAHTLFGGHTSVWTGTSYMVVAYTTGAIILPPSSLAVVAATGALSNYELISYSAVTGQAMIVSGAMVGPSANMFFMPGASGAGGPIRRAVFSMPVPGLGSEHSIGTRFAWLNDRLNRKPPGIMKIPLDAAWIGNEMLFRFAAYGASGGIQNTANLQLYGYTPSGLAFNQFSSRPSYTQQPGYALFQSDPVTIQMPEVTEAFGTNTTKYNPRSFTIGPVSGFPVSGAPIYYVTIYDPQQIGDFGTQTNLNAYCDANQNRVQAIGYVYIGSIIPQASNFGEDIVTPGGWPPPTLFMLNGQLINTGG